LVSAAIYASVHAPYCAIDTSGWRSGSVRPDATVEDRAGLMRRLRIIENNGYSP
jgi:hypothetical protein